jgi:hypothetical protein
MLRTFNYTNRRRIQQKEVSIRTVGPDHEIPRLQADLNLDASDYPADATVYVEAYYKETRQRFCFGTIARIAPPADPRLNEIDLTGTTQFRVLVVDESGRHALILGSGEGFQTCAGETGEENRSSLLVVVARPMGALPWRVEFANDGKPILAINQRVPGAIEKVRSNAIFQALILPAATRVVLARLMGSDEIDEDSEVYLRWKAFAMQFTDVEPDTEDAGAFEDWLDEVVSEFAKRFDLCDRLADMFREEDPC